MFAASLHELPPAMATELCEGAEPALHEILANARLAERRLSIRTAQGGHRARCLRVNVSAYYSGLA